MFGSVDFHVLTHFQYLNFKANFLKICKMLVATFFLQISLFVQTETWLEYSLD